MPTAACGIDCSVCRLNLLGICSTCGSGRSEEGSNKIEAQKRILGRPCAILSCAFDRQVDYCPRDCDQFPCDCFVRGPYPYSEGYLNMQRRRRKEFPPLKSPSGYEVEVPSQHWDDLMRRDIKEVCINSLGKLESGHEIDLPFLKGYLRIDLKNRILSRQIGGDRERIQNPLLELITLIYLLRADSRSHDQTVVGVKELKTAHFFQGPHELKIWPLMERYGDDPDGFRLAGKNLGGEKIDMADVAFRFQVFPMVPLYYLFWAGDEEFKANFSVLFNRSIEHHLTADAVWGLVTLITDMLVRCDFL